MKTVIAGEIIENPIHVSEVSSISVVAAYRGDEKLYLEQFPCDCGKNMLSWKKFTGRGVFITFSDVPDEDNIEDSIIIAMKMGFTVLVFDSQKERLNWLLEGE